MAAAVANTAGPRTIPRPPNTLTPPSIANSIATSLSPTRPATSRGLTMLSMPLTTTIPQIASTMARGHAPFAARYHVEATPLAPTRKTTHVSAR